MENTIVGSFLKSGNPVAESERVTFFFQGSGNKLHGNIEISKWRRMIQEFIHALHTKLELWLPGNLYWKQVSQFKNSRIQQATVTKVLYFVWLN